MDLKKVFIISVVLALLFGVSVGYQLQMWFGTEKEGAGVTNTNTTTSKRAANSALASPIIAKEVYTRSGTVASVKDSSIIFNTYIQNQDATYTAAAMTAKIDDKTTFVKINLKNPQATPVTISLSDIKQNGQIAVETDENMYGKTIVTAKSIQLHTN
jgi:hypothetical protein